MHDMPRTMKGLQITQFKEPYQLAHDIPVPKIERPNDVLIKIAVAGYCHTEIMVANGELKEKMAPGSTLPLIPSHEGAGTVVAFGSGVTNLKVGDRVATLAFKDPCGKCLDCTEGMSIYCDHISINGITRDGAAAEYMLADGNFIIPLPPAVSFETAAPLMCAGATIYNGLKVANLRSGQTVAIIGAGALGHLGVQFAKCMGLRVVCVDTRQAPLTLVKSLKYAPDFAIDATRGADAALQEIGGRGVDATIVVTDALPAYEYGLKITKKHGTFVIIGQPFDPIPIHYNWFIFRNINIKGSLVADTQTVKEMVDLVAEKGIEVRTRAYPLEDVERLMSDYHESSHAGKLVLRVAPDPE